MPAPHGRRPRMVALFLAANFLYWIALYLYVPTLGAYVGRYTQDLAMVGLVLSMYGLWQAFARFPVGIAVDATGNGKPFIVAGFAMAAAGALVMGAGRSVAALAVGRGLSGLAAATWVPLTAIFSGLFPPERAVLAASLLNLTGSMGRVAATALNGVLNEAGGYGLPFALAAACGGSAIVIVIATPIQRQPPRRPSVASLRALLRRRDVVLPSLLQTVLVFGEWAVPLSFLPLLAEKLATGEVARSLLVSFEVACGMVSNAANTWLERRMRPVPVVRLAFALLTAGIVAAALAPTPALLFAAAALIGLGLGLGYPTLVGLTLRGVVQTERSTAIGLHQATYAIGMFGGPWLGGVLASIVGLRLMFAIVACLVFGGSWVLIQRLAKLRAAAPVLGPTALPPEARGGRASSQSSTRRNGSP